MSIATAASPNPSTTITVVLAPRHRHGLRAPAGGITIRGRHFRGGQWSYAGPADPAPAGVTAGTTPARIGGLHIVNTPASAPAKGVISNDPLGPKGLDSVETLTRPDASERHDGGISPIKVPALARGVGTADTLSPIESKMAPAKGIDSIDTPPAIGPKGVRIVDVLGPAAKGAHTMSTLPAAKGVQSVHTLPAPAVEPAVVAMTATTDPVVGVTPTTVAPTRLAIAGYTYAVSPTPIAPSVGGAAFRLDRLDTGHSYFVHVDNRGSIDCDCPAAAWRRSDGPFCCKHARSLVEVGLLKAPTPTTLPPFAGRGGDGHNLAGNEVMGPDPKRGKIPHLDGQVVHRGQAHRVRVAIEGGRIGYLVEMLRPSGEWLAGLAFEDRADAIWAARQADDDPDLNPPPPRSAPARPLALATA